MSVGSLIGGLAAPFISSGLNSLLGTGTKNKNVLNYAQSYDLGPPLSFSGDLGAGAVGLDYARPSVSGYNATGGGYRFGTTVNPDGTVSGGLDDTGSFSATTLTPRINRSLADLDQLRAGLQPGFGAVTRARRDAIEGARQRAVGDLRDTLARRRVEGSSFGNASLAQAEAEFAGKRGEADAQSYLQELEAMSRLIDQERQQLETGAADALKRAGVALEGVRGMTDIFARDAQQRMQLAESDLSTRRSLYGQDLASRRSAGLSDLANRRNLAAQEEADNRNYFRGAGGKVGNAVGGSLDWLTKLLFPSPSGR